MAYIVFALFSVAAGYVYYMVALHPLAKYPGPFIAKLTNLYSVWHAIRGTRHSDLCFLHEKYGEFVRWGPNSISINNAKALHEVHNSKANVQKSPWYTVGFFVNIFTAIDKDVHARKRRVMGHAFSDKAVREMEPYMIGAVRDWCAALGDQTNPTQGAFKHQWSAPKDMKEWGAYSVFDSMGELLFGRSFNTSSSKENLMFIDLLSNAIRLANIVGQMPILTRLHVDRIMFPDQHRKRHQLVAFAIASLKKRLSMGPDSNGRRDIVHHLQQGRDPETGQGYSEQEMIGETVILMQAALDTTHTALASTLYFLVHHPDILARLTSSIRQNFDSVENIVSGATLSSNTYLMACIEEAMRLCPPVPTLLPRSVCSGGFQVLGHHFDEGTVIGIPTYALHHHRDYFDRPYEYDPLRWLVKEGTSDSGEGNSPEIIARQRQAFAPFSAGPRMCIAKNVALLELQLNLARVLFMYDIRMAPGTEHVGLGPHGEYKIKDHFVVAKEGPVLQFCPSKIASV
ncbi:benzoate 4-monooxygenase cytochrome-like protein P450 [Myriangium duriaei CBS 260.36]|uniref:Benzoate 4-monooxygenase cytochrome-like protein P450 n=1 Tax=Myriangium duriaei CBS 260.36 TaxID=1168546 RepID=A0A9P4MEN7_9PEZI|nr:benzoate 4-monooxygenase cytochrome-like protein P450 [Myriangium duriaei CBS 260.36]